MGISNCFEIFGHFKFGAIFQSGEGIPLRAWPSIELPKLKYMHCVPLLNVARVCSGKFESMILFENAESAAVLCIHGS